MTHIMNTIIGLLELCLLLFFVSCGQSTTNKPDTKTVTQPTFIMPVVPSMITTPEARAEFIAEHYWDKYNFTDTSLISRANITEQAFADFIHLSTNMNSETANKGIKIMMGKAEVDSAMYAHFMELCEKYLYDPNSPTRNEGLYVAALESILSNNKLKEIDKARSKYQHDLSLKNCVGDKATNFTYTTVNDIQSNLHDIKAEYILIFFHNPDCASCVEIRKYIIESSIQNDKRVRIFAMYADNNLKLWNNYLPYIPQNWINGYDKYKKIDTDKIYDLRASPTLYLLSKDKTVLLKDPDIKIIESFLENTINGSATPPARR